VLCGGSPVFPGGCRRLAVCVGNCQGQVFELGDEGAEAAVVVEPVPVVVELVVGDEPGNRTWPRLVSMLLTRAPTRSSVEF
jgi:hypothetical protein